MFRSSACLLALVLMVSVVQVRSLDDIDSEDGERVKRQSLTFSATSNGSTGTVSFNGVETIVVGGFMYRTFSIDDNATIEYNGMTVTVTGQDVGMIGGIASYTHVSSGNVLSRGTTEAISGPGTLYLQEPNALFSQSDAVDSFIERVLESLFEPIEVMLASRITPDERISLNIDATTRPPDGIASVSDDVMSLSGSQAFPISAGQTVSYSGNRLLVRTRSTINEEFTAIMSYSVLQPKTTGGLTYSVYNSSTGAAPAVNGPGLLRVGMQGGQRVAFYSTVDSVNQDISTMLVNMQMMFQVVNTTAAIVASFPQSLMNQRLIRLNGAQEFSYPTATTVQRSGDTLTVMSDSQLLQRFSLPMGTMVSSFIDHQVARTMNDVTYNIPSGGVTLLFNGEDNDFFLYPARNQIISGGISQAMESANIVQPTTTASYTLSADQFGFGTLFAKVQDTADEVEVVNVAPATVVNVGSRESVSYANMMVEILDSNGNPTRSFPDISPFTVNSAGTQYQASDQALMSIFGGPGSLYLDTFNRGFYTANPQFETFITNFVSNIPEPRIDIIKDPDDGLTYFQTGGQNLFNLNGASSMTLGSDVAGVYRMNTLNFVRTYNVPDNAEVVYDMATDRVVVRDPNDPARVLFQNNAMLLREYDDVTQSTPSVRAPDKSTDFTFPFSNGNIYYSERGALVSSSDAINEGISITLFSMGTGSLQANVVPSIQDVMNLTVADGNSIVTYRGMSPTLIPSGGVHYFSRDGDNAMYIANNDFNSQVVGIFSQLNPSTSSYNRSTGAITLTTSDGDFISSLQPGITPVTSISGTTSIRYVNETIIFTPAIMQPLEMINELTVWNGLMSIVYDRSNDGDFTLNGPGIFWFDGDRAFFTSDSTTVNQISQRISNTIGTFRAPILSRSPLTFTSKFNQIDGGFPQTITLYEGADVELPCTVLAGSPQPTISFFERVLNDTTGELEYVQIMNGDKNFMISQVGNEAVLRINDINPTENGLNGTGVAMYRCLAQNMQGSASLSTTINIRPPQSPAIVTGFIPPLSTVRNSSERLISITAGSGTNGNALAFSARNITIAGSSIGDATLEDDGTVIVRTIHIGCKGEGLPKSDIVWYQLAPVGSNPLDDMRRVLINATGRLDINITVPRQGRSVLSIDLDQDGPACTRYICEASNRAGTALGGVDICTQNYFCEGITAGDCTVTCGFGLIAQTFQTCLVELANNDQRGVTFESIPGGIFSDLPLSFCFENVCPVITYEYAIVDETPCSATCGLGTIMRNSSCIEVTNGVANTSAVVSDDFCAGQSRPSMFLTCGDESPCPFWTTGQYGECSATCDGGIREREVNCTRAQFDPVTFELSLDVDNETILFDTLNDTFCTDRFRPLDTIPCNRHIPCPLRWRPADWGPCNEMYPNCQFLDIQCERYDIYDYLWPGEIVDDSLCENRLIPRPHQLRSCGGGTCRPAVWQVDTVGQCSVTCGPGGRQSVSYTCGNASTTADDFLCTDRIPDNYRVCPASEVENCPGQCDIEEDDCIKVKLIGCDRPDLFVYASRCCKSCPKQYNQAQRATG